MARRKTVTHFVAVSDLSQPATEQEGVLIEVEGKEGDTPQNRTKALEVLQQMWEKGEIAADKFPDGMTQEHLFYVPPESSRPQESQTSTNEVPLAPIVQGAQEIVQLTKLQIDVQEAAEEASPYVPIIKSVLEKTRPLTSEEKELVKDKKYGKTIERFGVAVAEQEDYQQHCTGNGNLILNAIAWQLDRANNSSDEKEDS
jgi:hypothetical protein